MGFGHGTSLFGVAMALVDGAMTPLAIALLAFVVGLPAVRFI